MNLWAALKLMSGANVSKMAEPWSKMTHVLNKLPHHKYDQHVEKVHEVIFKIDIWQCVKKPMKLALWKPRVMRFWLKSWVCNVLQPNFCHNKQKQRRLEVSQQDLFDCAKNDKSLKKEHHYGWWDMGLWPHSGSQKVTRTQKSAASSVKCEGVHHEYYLMARLSM